MPNLNCNVCGKIFYVKKSHQKLGWGKYCSIECYHSSQKTGKVRKCEICGKKVYRIPSKILQSKSGKFFCSKGCHMHWKNKLASRENHWNWKGGSKIYREILMTVTSNKLVCALCMIEEKRVLVAHHIDHNRKNNEVSNLIWLCMNCHYLVHHDEKLNFKIQNRNLSRLSDHCPLVRSNLMR